MPAAMPTLVPAFKRALKSDLKPRLTPLATALALALSALLTLLATPAAAITTVLAQTGTQAPGAEVGTTFSLLAAPQLNNSGEVLFSALLQGTKVTAANASGLWRGQKLVARTGDTAPGTTNGFASLFGASFAGDSVVYQASLAGAGVTAANDRGVWRDTALVAREGNTAPGTFLKYLGFSSVSGNAVGQTAFVGALVDERTNLPRGNGVWRDQTPVALGGDPAPGAQSTLPGVSPSFGSSFNFAQINALGQTAYRAGLVDTGGSGNDSGLWRDSVMLVQAGQQAPGTGSGVAFAAFTNLKLNDRGQVAYEASLVGTAVVAGNDRGLWLDGGLIAREGGAATAAGANLSLGAPALLGVNNNSQVAYSSVLSGVGVGANNSASLWRNNTPLVRQGDAVDTDGLRELRHASVQSFSTLAAGGQLAWFSSLAGVGVSAANNGALFIGDGVEQVLVARRGDALAKGTIEFFGVATAMLNDAGQISYQAGLVGGDQAIAVFTPALRWRSGSSGNWADAARWTLSLNPGAVHDVTLDPSASLTITGPSDAVSVNSLLVGSGSGVATLKLAGGSINASSAVRIAERGVLTGQGRMGAEVINEGVVLADQLVLAQGLVNQGVLRGAAGTGGRVETNLNNTLGGRVQVGRGEQLQLVGKQHSNAGVFEIDGGRLETTGDLRNVKGGLIDLNAATAVANDAWVNETGARLLLADARLTAGGGLLNSGQVLVSSGQSDLFGSIVNAKGGQIILSGQGTTSFYDAVEMQSGAELRVSSSATAVFFGPVQQRTGALFSGTGAKFFEGGLSVGNSPGAGSDAGDVSFGAGNTYLAELGGTTPGSGHDYYSVAGQLSLGGTLQLMSFDSFVAQAGDRFDLFDAGQLSGLFGRIDSSALRLAAGTRLDLSQLSIDGSISVTAVPEPGSWALLLSGLLGLGGLGWKRRHIKAPWTC